LAIEDFVYLTVAEAVKTVLAVESDDWKVDEIEIWLRQKVEQIIEK